MNRIVGMGIVAGAFLAVGVAEAATTYPLKCRPGPQTSLNISVRGEIRFGFQRSSGPAGQNGQNLRPGECAWVDRAVGSNEPAVVAATLGPNFKVGAMVPHVSNNSFKAYAYAASQAWVYNFMTQDTILTVHAFNEDGQVMRVPTP